MNSAQAGTPVSQKNSSKQGFMFNFALSSFTGLIHQLNRFGLTLNRVHYKPATEKADDQLMLVFERSTSQVSQQQSEEIVQKFLSGHSYTGSVRMNGTVAATGGVHTGTPEHILISGNGATPSIEGGAEFRINTKYDELLKRIPQVRVPLHLPADMVDLVPAWVEKRGR